MNVAAFFSYIFMTAFTPGPNNIMAMTNAAKLGFRKGFRFCIGVLFGFLIVMCVCALFTTLLFQYIPAITPVMKWIGAAYILYLAVHIWRDKPGKRDGKQRLNPESLLNGMVMQFVNVKVILYGITAMSVFILPHYSSIPAAMAGVGVLTLTGFAGTCCWALFGSLFQSLFQKHGRILNGVMALLLIYCAVSSLIN